MRCLLCLFVFLSGLSHGGAALSHPHVFVDAEAGFTFDEDGRLVSLRVTWTYDAFASLMLFDILDLDKDGDGKLDDADRAIIVAGETDWPEGYEGDIHLETGAAKVALTRPANGSSWMADDRITVAFDLPLDQPLSVAGDYVLRFYDPMYFYAYAVVAVDDSLPDGCSAEIIPFEPDDAAEELLVQLAALSREESPEQEDVGRLFADQVWLKCA
ncbi:MAG: DUF1007 family protein [Rhodobacter sp.]|nr:DUF1007 family protein [Rhodobacter sp.]